MNPGSSTLQNSSCMDTYLSSHKPSKSVKQDILDTAGETRMNSYMMFSCGLLHMDTPMLADQ